MDLNSAWVFVKVVQAGSFSQAGRQLGMPVSTVSTKVSLLEKRLGVTLLRRTTRKLHLTEAGERYFEHSLRAVSELQEAESSTTQAQEEAQGLLRITGPVEMGMSSLADVIAEFQVQYPKVKIDLLITDRVVDLVGEGVDLAIRAGELDDSSLISRRLGASRFLLFASPEYLRKAGAPARPKDLEQHDCLRFTAEGEEQFWDLRRGEKRARVRVQGTASANNLLALHRLATRGRGIALLPEFLCTDEVAKRKLVPVLPGWASAESPIHLVYPQQKYTPRRLRVLIDYLAANLKEVF